MNKPTQLEMALLAVTAMMHEAEDTYDRSFHDPSIPQQFAQGQFVAMHRVVRYLEKQLQPEGEPLPEVLAKMEPMVLGKEAFDKFCDAIENAKAPNEALKKAADKLAKMKRA